MGLVMSSDVRKDDVMMKKAVVSKPVIWVNKWLMSGLPKGPCRSAIVLGRVVFQWGFVVDCGGEAGRVDSPSTVWGCMADGDVGSFK